MKQTAVEWLFQVWVEQEHIAPEQWEMAKAMEKIEKLKRQLFIGKVSEIIGIDKTIELWKECIETFKSE